MHAMSDGPRREAAPHGVRVITVAPGMLETELLLITRSQDIRYGYEAYRDRIGGGLDAHAVAEAVQFVYEPPEIVCVPQLVIAPTVQAV